MVFPWAKEVVVFALPNSIEYAALSLAVIANGGVVSGVNPIANSVELNRQIRDSNARFVAVSAETVEKTIEAVRSLPKAQIKGLIHIGDMSVPDSTLPPTHEFNNLVTTQPSFDLPPVTLNFKEDLCMLPYSSGTTGTPKGVMLTHYSQVAMTVTIEHWQHVISCAAMAAANVNPAEDTLLGYLPFFHIYGFMFLFFIMKIGGHTVTMPRFDPQQYLQLLQQYKVKTLNLVPPIAQFLAKHPLVDKYDLSSLRIAFSGGAPLSKEAERQLCTKHTNIQFVGQGYGMTETGMATHLPGFMEGKYGNAGVLAVNNEVKIVDPENGRELGIGENGEIWLRGPSLMKGYLNKSEATAATLDDDGWIHTGDIGHADTDMYIYVVDRIKELIKVKGLQVAPAELESLLNSHPNIADAAVIGVPDTITGEAPRAFVVMKMGGHHNTALTEKEVQDYVAARVSPYKRLTGGVVFVDEIPKSPSGKILRRILRDRLKQEVTMKNKL